MNNSNEVSMNYPLTVCNFKGQTTFAWMIKHYENYAMEEFTAQNCTKVFADNYY